MTRPVDTSVDPRFSTPGAEPVPWDSAVTALGAAEIFWISTVRADGRPHVTPLAAIWIDDALLFTTGPTEQKARNLATNPMVTMTTGANRLEEGLDLVVEGVAELVTDTATLERAAEAYRSKYGDFFEFRVRERHLWSEDGGPALLFAVRATRAFGFGKGDAFSQTRWRFADG
jgi:nitroimidazol reductase NimA-like FMN-containing flavoprotein (pyridoxamine 5'-phosphate oxidase superfamily)